MSEPSPAPDVIGWCAVAMPLKAWHQTFLIREEDRERAPEIDKVVTYSIAHFNAPGVEKIGALSGFVAQLAIEKPDSPMLTAGAALLSEEIGHPYWWVEAKIVEGQMATSVHRLEATNPEEAEAAFKDQPLIRMMSMTSLLMNTFRQPGKEGG